MVLFAGTGKSTSEVARGGLRTDLPVPFVLIGDQIRYHVSHQPLTLFLRRHPEIFSCYPSDGFGHVIAYGLNRKSAEVRDSVTE